MNNKKGFTLVELLAVIAILAILVIIALPNVLNIMGTAKSNLGDTLASQVEEYLRQQIVLANMGAASEEYMDWLESQEISAIPVGNNHRVYLTKSLLEAAGVANPQHNFELEEYLHNKPNTSVHINPDGETICVALEPLGDGNFATGRNKTGWGRNGVEHRFYVVEGIDHTNSNWWYLSKGCKGPAGFDK